MIKKIKLRLSSMLHNFKIIYKDRGRKSFFRIFKEFIIASIKSKSFATYYFTDFLYSKNIKNYLDYISHKEWQYMQRAICDSNTASILGNKLYTQYYFEKFKIPMPNLLGYNIREKMIIKSDDSLETYEVINVDSFQLVIKNLIEKSINNTVFVKPTIGSGGHDIFKIEGDSDNTYLSQLDTFFKQFLTGSFIFQDEVKPHPDLAKFNPRTLNSIRMDVFKAAGQKPEVISAFFRVGGSNAAVDNASSGGCFIGVDIESGELKDRGTKKLAFGGSFITHHPETGIKFEGYKIPFFENVKSLAISAANCFPQCLVGWDIAITDTGPVLIEGNTLYYAMSTCDIAYGGYRKNPVYNKVTDYVKNILKK